MLPLLQHARVYPYAHECKLGNSLNKPEHKITCFLHNVHRPLDSRSLLHIFEKLIVCLTNFLSFDMELDEERSLELIIALLEVWVSFPSVTFQEKYTNLWLEGT